MKKISALALIAAVGLAPVAYAQAPGQPIYHDDRVVNRDNGDILRDDEAASPAERAAAQDAEGNEAAAPAEHAAHKAKHRRHHVKKHHHHHEHSKDENHKGQ